MDTRPIGMFDSGVGGVTVLKEIIKRNNENIIYLGDSKRFPYGSKSKETIIELTKQGIDFLIHKANVKAVVIACGTATSQALEEVKDNYSIPIIGIIESTVEYLKEKQYKKVGIMATAGTIRSKGWEENIKRQLPEIEVYNKACPLLAPMAEEGWTENEVAKLTIQEYLKELKQIENLDCLILGCTHYPLFQTLIEEELGKQIEIINTGEILSKKLKYLLEERSIQNQSKKIPNYEMYLTDKETNFIQVANQLLGSENKIEQVEQVEIEE